MNLDSLQSKPISGKQLTRKSHPVFTQLFFFFFSLHKTCRRIAFVLLCHHPVLRSKYKIKNFFSVSHTLSSKKIQGTCGTVPKATFCSFSLPRDENCDQMEECLHFREATPKYKEKPFFYHCLPLCFD